MGLLGGAFVLTRTLAACGFGPSAGGGEAVGSSEDGLVSCDPPIISANHGHALAVAAEDIAAGEDKTYSIKGSSSHPHSVTITAKQFAELAAGGAITVVSSTDAGHKHTVTVTCSAATKPDADAAATADGGLEADAAQAGDASTGDAPSR